MSWGGMKSDKVTAIIWVSFVAVRRSADAVIRATPTASAGHARDAAGWAAGVNDCFSGVNAIPIVAPLPDISGHVEKTVISRRETPHYRRVGIITGAPGGMSALR